MEGRHGPVSIAREARDWLKRRFFVNDIVHDGATGETWHDTCGSLKRATICWGGLLAEDMHCYPEALQPLRPWFRDVIEELDVSESGTDRNHILIEPLRWKACKMAYRILTRKKDLLIRVAQCLADYGECCEDD